MDKYIYMTVYQFADAIASAPWNTLFDFTYDSKMCEDDIPDPTGWYGIKITRLFDEEDGVLCYGYYGGGCSQAIDLYMISDDTYDVRENQKAIEKQFKKWSEYAYDELGKTVCVEVTDANRQWIDDLYHIIGMGNLDAVQLSHIVKLTKILLKYRPDIKFFAVQNTITVPKRKEFSTYNLSSGVKLVNKKGE